MNHANGSRYATRMDGAVRLISIPLSLKNRKNKNKRKKQHCFKKFSYFIKEESDDEEETDDYTCIVFRIL